MARGRKKPLVRLDQEAVKFVFKNDFIVYPLLVGSVYQIIIQKGTKEVKSKETYSPTNIHQAIADTYSRIYKQYGNS